MSKKSIRAIKITLIVISVLAAIKMIFFDYTMDEEYQILQGYRLLRGDRLFGEMWEPHQTSAFLCQLFMWMYVTITGTFTGIIVYLRVCTTFIQVGLTVYLYYTLKNELKEEYAFYISLLYFNIVPKLIEIPEFSNMQVWFFTLLVIFFFRYYGRTEQRRVIYIFLAGIAMSLEVLSYPSCVLLFFFFLIQMGIMSGKKRWRDMLIFTLVCIGCAAIYLGLIWIFVSPREFADNLSNVIAFDSTHSIDGTADGKLIKILRNLKDGSIMTGCCMLFAAALNTVRFLLNRKKKKEISKRNYLYSGLVFMILGALLIQLYFWIVKKAGFETPQLYLFIMALAGILAWPVKDSNKQKYLPGMLGGLVSFLSVVYLSDLEMYTALPHGFVGSIFAVILLVLALEKEMGEGGRKWIRILLISLVVVCCFGKGFTLRQGRKYQTILDTENIMKYGPAIGIFSDYMTAYIYNSDYECFMQNVKPDENVLIVVSMVYQQTTPYLFCHSGVSHFSVVDPTTYDEKLLAYWEKYPEKYPDVIIVDCWYGQLIEKPDSWIMNYIEKDFGYTSITDGDYVRIYRR